MKHKRVYGLLLIRVLAIVIVGAPTLSSTTIASRETSMTSTGFTPPHIGMRMMS